MQHFKKEELVYLTADSETQIDDLNPSHAYVIGGIVDRNRYKNLTLEKAKKEGLSTARLPIQQYM